MSERPEPPRGVLSFEAAKAAREAKLAEAQADMDRAVAKAAISDDPIGYLIRSLSAAMGAVGVMAENARQSVDPSFLAELEKAVVEDANRHAESLARVYVRRNMVAIAGAAFGIAAVSAALGWYVGSSSVVGTESGIAMAAEIYGTAAAGKWLNLMESNDIDSTLGQCKPMVVDGRRACWAGFWLDPPSRVPPAINVRAAK